MTVESVLQISLLASAAFVAANPACLPVRN
jgi:hypothetical protein